MNIENACLSMETYFDAEGPGAAGGPITPFLTLRKEPVKEK